MLNEWRFGKEVEFPENIKTLSKPLSASEDFLPEGLKVEKPDLISRAKTEWHFIVLSKKLYDFYDEELKDLKEKITELNEFSSEYWEKLKGFWGKVQNNLRDKSLFRNHADNLKKRTDDLFETLKQYRKDEEAKLRESSQKYYVEFGEKLDKIEEKIEKGLGLQPIFEELKNLQSKFFKTKFSREHRRKLLNRIDKAFKQVKTKRFGDSANERSPMSRLQRRYDGLLGAIEKMQKSIDRDKKDMDWQNNLSQESGGQLEVQLREARVMMIKERINSKSERLDDMLKTKAMLEKKMEAEKKREEQRKLMEQAKKEAKEKIKEQVQESNKLLEENKEELEKAAEKMQKSKPAKNTAITDNNKKEETDKKEEPVQKEEIAQKEEVAKPEETVVKEEVVVEVDKEVEEKSEGIISKISDKVEEIADKVEDKVEDIVEKTKDVAEIVVDNVKETVEEIKEKLKEEEE